MIVHDRLIPATALDGARPDAERYYVGKEGGGPSVSQEDIGGLLREHGAAGRSVVRLKGGDPFVFGRGGEEAELLREAGIPFEVVPGVTAAVAASAYAGIPVTHRDAASAVAFVTGHEDPGKPESALDWNALAAFPGTLAVYMGVARLSSIADRLRAGGRPGSEPAAVIERGTWPGQRVVTGTLETIADVAAEAGIRAPAISLFGAVAALRDRLAWFETRPLHGRTIAVTRARAQASGLAAAAARARCGGGRGTGDPGPRAPRGDPRHPGALRPRVPDQSQRRRVPVRPTRRRRARRPCAPPRPDRRDRTRYRAGASPSAGSGPMSSPSASSPRGSSMRWPTCR